jgi:molybdopterin/thiamine biosynthesis adenylyltransferase
MIDPREALARTALLTRDIYPTLTGEQILAGLTTTTVLLRADPESCSVPAGQTAIITAAILAAQLGARLSIDLPVAPVLEKQPPLRPPGMLASRIEQHLSRLITPPCALERPPDIELRFGQVAAKETAGVSIQLTGDGWGYRSEIATEPLIASWEGDAPFGGIMAGGAAAAEVYRTSLRRLGRHCNASATREHRLEPHGSSVSLSPIPLTVDIGRVDMISAGAIIQGALFALGRLPGVSGDIRVIEHDTFTVSNLNRYPLSTADDLDLPKIEIVSRLSTPQMTVHGVPQQFDDASANDLSPLSDRLLVGVDSISARWEAQRHAPGWVWVGGTSHFGGYVWTHPPDEPCAGCANPTDRDADAAADIPTISFVSTITGTLLAYEFLAAITGNQPPTRALQVSPFNLTAPMALLRTGIAPHADCRVGCRASRAAS